jgi:hypothetical protein
MTIDNGMFWCSLNYDLRLGNSRDCDDRIKLAKQGCRFGWTGGRWEVFSSCQQIRDVVLERNKNEQPRPVFACARAIVRADGLHKVEGEVAYGTIDKE